ncbi:hypothetical protein Tco_1334712 [Tanacetum coccineum]
MSGEEPAPQMAPVKSPQMISTIKLPMLKKGEYTLWSMRMEQYLTNTNYGLWQVIMNGKKERKAKSALLLVIPDEYQLRFNGIKDAKTLWAIIKSRFGGNVESKKMQKNVLKQQFKNLLCKSEISKSSTFIMKQHSFDYEKQRGNVVLLCRRHNSINKVNMPIGSSAAEAIAFKDMLFVIITNDLSYHSLLISQVGLTRSQIALTIKTGLRYGDQLNENGSSGSELFNSVFGSRSSDEDDNQTNDRFKKDNEYHAVPPPLNGNYIPPLADLSFARLDDSIYRLTANKTSARLVVVIIDRLARNETVKTDKQAVKPRMVTQSPKLRTVKENGVTAVKASASCVWRPKKTDLNNGSKDNSGSRISKRQSDAVRKEFEAQCNSQEKITRASSANSFNTVSTPKTFSPVGPSSGPSFIPFGGSSPIDAANLPHDPLMPELEDTAEIQSTGIFGNAYDDHDLETLNTPYADQSVVA